MYKKAMFRKIRRQAQELSPEETRSILQNATTAVLALSGDDGYPYAVPLNFVCCENKIYFHSAKEGHKIDAIRKSDKVSLCIIDRDEVCSEKLTSIYKSVIVFGRARILQTEQEIFRAAELLGLKYNDDAAFVRQSIHDAMTRLACVEITIEHASGKQAKELVPQSR